MRDELQGTNGSQLWDTSIAVQALLEVLCSVNVSSRSSNCKHGQGYGGTDAPHG